MNKVMGILIGVLLLASCTPQTTSQSTPIASATPEPLLTPSFTPVPSIDTANMSAAEMSATVDRLSANIEKTSKLCPQDRANGSMECANTAALIGADNLEKAVQGASEPPPDFFASPRIAKSCQAAVTNILKAPSTASFVEQALSVNPSKLKGLYRLSGKADAQNSFGAMLRQEYSCYFAYTTKGGNFLGVSVP